MKTIVEVKALEDYTVWVLFSDRTSGTISLKPFISQGISSALQDPAFFKKVTVDEFGGIVWENGYDFCPNYLYQLINGHEAKHSKNEALS